VQATDSKGVNASKTFPVNIASTSLAITPVTPGTGTVGQAYSQCVAASGGTPPYTFSATLPAGLSIDPTTGCISGTPSVGGPVQHHRNRNRQYRRQEHADVCRELRAAGALRG
jgi:hypothetical protein